MWGLMFPLAVALTTDLLGVAKRWELRLNRVLQSLDFLNHSPWELEQTISFVLICCFVCVPSFVKEEAYTFSNIQGQLLYSWYVEIDESGFNNLVLLYSFSVLCRYFHCKSIAVLMTVTKLFKILAPRYDRVSLLQPTVFAFLLQQLGLEALLDIFDDLNIFRVTGETRMWILPPLLTDDAFGVENENTVEVDFHKGQHEMTELAVMDRIHEVISFRGIPAPFLPWFSGKLVETGFGDVLFSEFLLIARISHHHPIFDLLIDQKSFVDREKYKTDIKWELLILCVVTYIDISRDNVNYSNDFATSSSCRVAIIDCLLDDVLDGKEEYKLLWPPGTLTVRALLPFPLMISHVVFRICLVLVPFIIKTKMMHFSKALVDYKAFDTFEHLRPLALHFIRSKALWPFSPIYATVSLVAVHAFSTQGGVCYEVFKKGIKFVLCTKCDYNYTSTITMERNDVACDSSKWVICLIFHRAIRLVHGAVVLGSPSCIQFSLLLWETLKDADEFIDTRSKSPTVLVAVTLIHVQLCLEQPACHLCCFLQDLTSLMDCDFSLDDVMNVPTYSDHTSCSLSTREDFFQGESLSCASWNHNLVFSDVDNDALGFYREITNNNGYIQLVQVKKIICVVYHVLHFMFPRGNRMLSVITERVFSFVRPSWSSLALGSVNPTIHLFHMALSLHELRHGVLTTEFGVVSLESIAAGSEQMEVVESSTLVHVHTPIFEMARHENSSSCDFMSAFMWLCDCFNIDDVSGLIPCGLLVFGVSTVFPRDSVQVMEFVCSFSHVLGHLLDHLKGSYDRYKAAVGWRQRDLQFCVGAYVWAVFTKECFVSGSYNYLQAGTIDQLELRGTIYTWEIHEKVNAKVYTVLFPSDARCFDVFNVPYLYPCISIADTKIRGRIFFYPG